MATNREVHAIIALTQAQETTGWLYRYKEMKDPEIKGLIERLEKLLATMEAILVPEITQEDGPGG